MQPQKLEGKRPAGAPPAGKPKAAGKFGRLREKRFMKAVELARIFCTKKKGEGAGARWGAIVGSREVQKRLEAEGIESVLDGGLAFKNEIIINRGMGSADSNFFVFIKFGAFKTTALFTDPSPGEGGRALSKSKLMRRRNSWRAGGDWAGKTAGEITRVSSAKATDSFYACLHAHWGENGGRDDGVSPRKSIMRQFMLWHYDVDATGYHNWIDREAIMEVAEREKRAGIVKVPSTEYSYRFLQTSGDNGRHLNLWFASMETAMDFHRRYLKDKAKEMPGMTPHGQEGVMMYIRDKRRREEMALGIAHPSCMLPMPGKRIPVGLLNTLNLHDENGEYYTWEKIVSFVRREADGVGAFNPTVGNYEVRFRVESVCKKIKELIAKYVGAEANMDENNINMAFAQAMKNEEGKFVYFDHDTHLFPPSRIYLRTISPLAYGRSVIHFTKEAMRRVRESGGLSAEEVIRIMRRGRNVGGTKLSINNFIELDNGALMPVKRRRNSLLSKAASIPANIAKGLMYAWLVAKEWVHRTRSMWEA